MENTELWVTIGIVALMGLAAFIAWGMGQAESVQRKKDRRK